MDEGRWYTSHCPVTTEIDRSVEAFLAERGPGEVSVASRPDLAPLAGDLNALWWREVEKILLRVTRDATDRPSLAPEERIFLDQGVLDWRLVPNGGMSVAGDEAVSTTALIRDLRGRLYVRLNTLFKNLPGFNQQSLDLFLSGR